jgi:K+-sensing histidine kinase KdpD
MLEAARMQKNAGCKMLWPESLRLHKRKETEALLDGFDVLPRRMVQHGEE